MAYAAVSACQNPTRVFNSGNVKGSIIGRGSSNLRWQGFRPWAIFQTKNNRIFQLQKTRTYLLKHPIFAAEADSVRVGLDDLSDVIRRFYTCINEKNIKEIEHIISIDCLLEDSTFPRSFQGKKEVMSFISQVIESMGDSVRFRIGTVCESSELTASLDWHLEWNEDQLPFSRGCSIFHCLVEDDKLVIKKAQIIVESPFKPGEVGLGLLRILSSLFDEFPKTAKWFLKSPNTIFMVASSIYNLLFAPFMNPFLAFYVTLWKLVVRLFGYVIRILHFVAKFVIKMSSNGDPTTST